MKLPAHSSTTSFTHTLQIDLINHHALKPNLNKYYLIHIPNLIPHSNTNMLLILILLFHGKLQNTLSLGAKILHVPTNELDRWIDR